LALRGQRNTLFCLHGRRRHEPGSPPATPRVQVKDPAATPRCSSKWVIAPVSGELAAERWPIATRLWRNGRQRENGNPHQPDQSQSGMGKRCQSPVRAAQDRPRQRTVPLLELPDGGRSLRLSTPGVAFKRHEQPDPVGNDDGSLWHRYPPTIKSQQFQRRTATPRAVCA